MAFKRDGDDFSLLNKLRKQRVEELFCYSIPEDEAFLMKNGRFACTVCHHRPVFDTVSTLAVHRGGKKHAAAVEIKKREKEEVAELYLKRQHEKYVKDGTCYNPKIKAAETSQKPLGYHPLLSSAPYNPVSKKNPKTNAAVRKTRVNLATESTSSRANEDITENGAVKTPAMLSNKDFIPQTIAQYRLAQKCAVERDSFTVKPYDKRNSSSNNSSNNLVTLGSSRLQQSQDQNEHYGDVEGKTENDNDAKSRTLISGQGIKDSKQTDVYVHEKFHKRKRKRPAHTAQPGVISEKQARMEQHLNLFGSGWKKDWAGNWIKDDSVEFDSDEETPNLV